jgi:hypothetical protein
MAPSRTVGTVCSMEHDDVALRIPGLRDRFELLLNGGSLEGLPPLTAEVVSKADPQERDVDAGKGRQDTTGPAGKSLEE